MYTQRNGLPWQRSRACHEANCVEVVVGAPAVEVLVRDSKDPDGPVLRFTASEWIAFVEGVAAGQFDLDRDEASTN